MNFGLYGKAHLSFEEAQRLANDVISNNDTTPSKKGLNKLSDDIDDFDDK